VDGPDDSEILVPLDRRVLWLWWTTGAVVVAVAVVPVAVIDFVARPLPAGVLTAALLVIGGAVGGVLPGVRYRRWRYALREQDLWIRRGVVWVTVTVIPYARLQFVDTRQGPLERLYGLAQLVVHTAAPGTSGRLPGLDATQAQRLRERLSEVEPDAAGV
jgi:uncharacterized protein